MPTIEPDRGGLTRRERGGFGGPPFAPPATALEGVWRAVHVMDVDTRRDAAGEPVRVVHARVHLGALLPLDVVVELECEDVARGEPTRWRMWSDHPQGAGKFVFEARLPEASLARVGTLRVRVRPAPDSPTDSARMRPTELAVPLARAAT